MRSRYTFLALGVPLAAIAIVAGVVAAVITPWTSPAEEASNLADGPTQADIDYGANSRLEPASSDPNVEFPAALSELPNPPSHLAVDPKSGDLWFVLFTYNGATNDLYHYRVNDGSVEKMAISASTGSEFFSDVAVDSRGHVISAEGDVVRDIDPNGGYKELALPPPANVAKQPGWDGSYVIDMALSDGGKAYLTRMNTAAVTELDLATGSVREIPVPASMGQFYFVELVGDSLWMTTWVDSEIAPSKTAVVNTSNGEINETFIKSSALVADGGGHLYVSDASGPGLTRVDSNAKSTESISPVPGVLSGALDFIASDPRNARLWMWGEGARGLGSLNTSTGATQLYQLPSQEETQPIHVPIGCQTKACPYLTRGSVTQVGGIAAAPNGDVYFSDKSFNRIGIVHPR